MGKEVPKCWKCGKPMQEELTFTEIKAGEVKERTIYVCFHCGLTKTV